MTSPMVGRRRALGILAVVSVGRVMMWGDSGRFAFVVAISVVGIVVMGCVVGGMLPLLLNRLGLDPATSSNPFIATLVDVLGIVIYLRAAQWLLAGAVAAGQAGS